MFRVVIAVNIKVMVNAVLCPKFCRIISLAIAFNASTVRVALDLKHQGSILLLKLFVLNLNQIVRQNKVIKNLFFYQRH